MALFSHEARSSLKRVDLFEQFDRTRAPDLQHELAELPLKFAHIPPLHP